VILWGIPIVLGWGVLGVYLPVIAAELRYRAQSTRQSFEAVVPSGFLPQLSYVPLPTWVNGYALEIPKIDLREAVLEAVDTEDEKGYMEALKSGVAHAKGTGLPGEESTQYYFAHSSGLPFWGERAVVFALLNRLEKGDEVLIYRENLKYRYLVTDKWVVSPYQVDWLTSKGITEQVVLQTCWPIGTNWKRLLVIAKPDETDLSVVDRRKRFDKISLAVKSQD
jgi:LPXTG-site transpeptidase (sortase) family protein